MGYEEIKKRIEDMIKEGDYEKALFCLDFLEEKIGKSKDPNADGIRSYIDKRRSEIYLLALEDEIGRAEDFISKEMQHSAVASLSAAERYFYRLRELNPVDLKKIKKYYHEIERLKPAAYLLCAERELRIAEDLVRERKYAMARAVLERAEKYVSMIPRPTSSKIPNEIKERKKKAQNDIKRLRKEIGRKLY